jgi:transcriptional regulator with XRE-family HTH domain
MLLSKRLKELRKNSGMTQDELGKLINVTKVSICCYEKGTRTPTLETLIDLARVFGVDVNYLIGNDNYIISDSNKKYGLVASNEEINLLKELRLNKKIYNRLLEEPKRTIEYLEKQLR